MTDKIKTPSEKASSQSETSKHQEKQENSKSTNTHHSQKYSIRLRSFLDEKPPIMSPFRLIIMVLIIVLGIYLLFSKTTTPSNEEKIFSGVDSINRIIIKKNTDTTELIKQKTNWQIKKLSYSFPAKIDFVRKYLKFLNELYGEKITQNFPTTKAGEILIFTPAGKHKIEIYNSIDFLILKSKNKKWKILTKTLDFILPSDHLFSDRKILHFSSSNVKELLLPIMTVKGIKKYKLKFNNDIWELGKNNKINYANTTNINNLLSIYENLNYSNLLKYNELSNADIFCKITTLDDIIYFYKIKNSCPPGKVALRKKDKYGKVDFCIDKSTYLGLIYPLPKILDARIIPFKNVKWTTLSIKTLKNSFKLILDQNIWYIVDSKNIRIKADRFTVENWIQKWIKSQIISVSKTTILNKPDVILEFKGVNRKKNKKINWKIYLKTQEVASSDQKLQNTYVKRQYENIVVSISSKFSKNELYAVDYFKNRKIFSDKNPDKITRTGFGITEEFEVMNNGKIFIKSPTNIELDFKTVKHFIRTLRTLRIRKFLPQNKNTNKLKNQMKLLDEAVSNPYKPVSIIIRLYFNDKIQKIKVFPNENKGFFNNRYFRFYEKDYKTLISVFGKTPPITQDLTETNQIQLVLNNTKTTLKRISDYWILKGNKTEILSLKTVNTYTKTITEIFKKAIPVYYGTLKSKNYLMFLSDFDVAVEFNFIFKNDFILINPVGSNVIYQIKVNPKFLTSIFKIKN